MNKGAVNNYGLWEGGGKWGGREIFLENLGGSCKFFKVHRGGTNLLSYSTSKMCVNITAQPRNRNGLRKNSVHSRVGCETFPHINFNGDHEIV